MIDFSTLPNFDIPPQEPRTPEYFAGLFDGEGTISHGTHQWSKSRQLRVGVTNTHYETLEAFKTRYGGSISFLTPGATPAAKRSAQWQLTGAESVSEFLLDVIPFLRIKREQALLALAFCYRVSNSLGRGSMSLTIEEFELRESIIQAIADLSGRSKKGLVKETD